MGDEELEPDIVSAIVFYEFITSLLNAGMPRSRLVGYMTGILEQLLDSFDEPYEAYGKIADLLHEKQAKHK